MNWIKVALRNAFKNKILSLAKLFGISLAFAVILFSTAYVYYETSFDKMVPDYEQVYRVIMDGEINGSKENFAVSSSHMAYALENDIPEIERAIRVKPTGNSNLSYEGNSLYENRHWYADSGFFEFFGLPVKKALEQPLVVENNIVISETIAINLFGSVENALNQSAFLRGNEVKISGVFSDLPSNFHIQADIFQPIQKDSEDLHWESQSHHTYFKTREPIEDLENLNFKITKMAYTYYHEEIDGASAQEWDDLKYHESNYVFFLSEPLADIHFSQRKFDPSITSNKTYVYGAIILSILVLIISSLNYVNLTLANLNTRLKEIGIRKTIGAYNQQIAGQFLKESILFWLLGFALALLLYQSAGKGLMKYLELEIGLSNQQLIQVMVVVFTLLILFNIITIFLPIRFTANKNVLNLLKAKSQNKNRLSFKTGFLFVQFVLSSLIIISAIVVQKQVSYLVNKERGYNTENILMFHLWELNETKRESFVNQLKLHQAINSVATSSNYFGVDPSMNSAYFEAETDENYFHTSMLAVDDGFAETFDFEMAQGRFFKKEMETDDKALVINQAAAKTYKGSGEVIGNQIIINDEIFKIIGIVQDFNYRSLYHMIQPLVLFRTRNTGYIYAKVEKNRVQEAISLIQKQWQDFNISRPFDYDFHEQVVADHYSKDQQAKKILLILSIISIAIACVGLYAISIFTMIRKAKEIGIRKLNGATMKNILIMLNMEFTKWIVLAFLVAAPLAWWGMQSWLRDFAYKTTIQWWIFVLVGLAMLLISLMTISWQSWRAARKNPVEALKSE